MYIKWKIKFTVHKRKWRKKNRHNETNARNFFPLEYVTVGKHTYGELNVLAFNSINHLRIGNYVSIGPEVYFIVSADHQLHHLSTFPFKTKIINGELEAVSKGDIVIDDDVWIGCGAIILSGVHIGQGAVIAAGTVVTKDVAPYTIVAGIPGKHIGDRFNHEVSEFLNTLDFNELSEEQIMNNTDLLYTDLVNMKYNEIKERFDWFPKKGGSPKSL